MASNQLEKELCSYCFYVKTVKKLYNDTRQIFGNINGASCFDSPSYLTNLPNGTSFDGSADAKPSLESSTSPTEWSLISCDINFKANTEISSEDDERLKHLFRNSASFFVLSARPDKRCRVVNSLLKQDFLNLSQSTALWRTLLFKFSMKCKSEKIESPSLPVQHENHHFSFQRKSFNIKSLQRGGAFTEEDVLVGDVPDPKPCYVEIHHNSELLLAGLNVVVPEIRPLKADHWHDIFSYCINNVQPIFILALEGDCFSAEELELVAFLRSIVSHLHIIFVKIPSNENSPSQTNSSDNNNTTTPNNSTTTPNNNTTTPNDSSNPSDDTFVELDSFYELADDKIFTLDQLCALLNLSESHPCDGNSSSSSSLPPPSSNRNNAKLPPTTSTTKPSYQLDMVETFDSFPERLHKFATKIHNSRILDAVESLIRIHMRCLDSMIALAFNMARGTVRVPARIKFARKKEEELYKTLMEISVRKQDEVKKMICETVIGKKEELIEMAANCEITNIELSQEGKVASNRDLKACSDQIEEFVLSNLNSHVVGHIVSSVDVLRESFTGILSRCLASLEEMDMDLEPGTSKTSKALKEMINAAYKVNITSQSNESLIKSFIEKIKQMFNSMLSRSHLKVDSEWKKKIAGDMLSTLTESKCQKLAKGICNQIKERIKRSHQNFETSLKQLEMKHSGRIEKTEEHRLRVRKEFAPRVARLGLESRSLRDLILYGKPKVGHMIGNGQYGVVFACDPWRGGGPCAVKILVPSDDKHWNDLAMEFYYTMNIPLHDRIVTLRGSVLDYTYNSGGSGPAVMLVMDRLPMDLHVAIEKKLNWIDRLQVSVDIIEGIRYLHSQGLVHRDIKLKNVLLDENNRGKLTDLGFCKPEALITYSVVGTPIHMAPELISGRYDHSVDVYAFGVLFWFICNGSVSLPPQFKECSSKEVLWTAVKRGVRPEKPKDVDPECWDLMLKCWDTDPSKRPLVGEIESSLRSIYDRIVGSLPPGQSRRPRAAQGQ